MDAVDEVKQRLNIEDVIGEYVELRRAGRNFKGLSPFGNERTPSFMVSPEKQIWHDFSTGRGGNVFSFVMEMEGLDFKGALELLARKAGVDLEQFRGNKSGTMGKEKERLFEAVDLAVKFYQAQLRNNSNALEYLLKKRAFSKETILAWRLGYSPNNGTALCDFLHSKGFSVKEIKEAGLSSQRYSGASDMFRGRIMIPLADAQGRIIGFTARLLADDSDAPKYINTPQTRLYDKSRHVFGLHFAKDAIRKNKFVVVAEGNLDVISSHQAGICQVVATAGTAMTESHLKALSRFTSDIRLSFDADKAGINATERAIPLASKVDVNLSIVTVPSGKDPDELIRQDVKLWEQTITKPKYALDWLIDRYKQEIDLTTARGKRQFSDTILAVVRELNDPVEQEHYLKEVGLAIEVAQDIIREKLNTKKPLAKTIIKTNKPVFSANDKIAQEFQKTQNHFLSLMYLNPNLRDLLDESLKKIIQDEPAKLLIAKFLNNPEETDETLSTEEDYGKILTLQYEELYGTIEPDELRFEAVRLRNTLVEKYVKMQKLRLSQALATADETDTTKLLEKAKHLDQLLKIYKGGA